MGMDKYVKPLQVAYWIGSRCCVLASDPKADKLVKIARPHTMDARAWQPHVGIRTHLKKEPFSCPVLSESCRVIIYYSHFNMVKTWAGFTYRVGWSERFGMVCITCEYELN